jgi:hypothetical protein
MAWALAHGIVQAQPDAPLELIRPEDAVYVRKYYEAQFGTERCEDMVRHASTNGPLKNLLERLDVELRLLRSQRVIQEKVIAETDAAFANKTQLEPTERLFLGIIVRPLKRRLVFSLPMLVRITMPPCRR